MLLSDKFRGKNAAILVGFIIFILPLLYCFLIQPQQWQIETLLREYDTEEHNVRILEQFGRDYPDIDQRLSLLDKKTKELNRILPNEPDLENLLLYIEENMAKHRLKLLSLIPGKTIGKTSYREIKIEILLQGEYFDVMNFIKNLEDGPRLISMQGISLIEREGQTEVKLEITVFSLK
ncbi:type 4a pilus biogenesis protein PilO [Acetonema longum]|uniref:Pilus assembly protein, PilO n=1 Tax=Acetonema longum DSM 6540 TaxID=1009370 RepID=F7NPR9_9FIRM|nr:type 4a pilus biogenesis protein PilO [Acetonema longum]EGO61910.1 hypothetical protein ALO_20582 [Acetonema longum DSM 6540]